MPSSCHLEHLPPFLGCLIFFLLSLPPPLSALTSLLCPPSSHLLLSAGLPQHRPSPVPPSTACRVWRNTKRSPRLKVRDEERGREGGLSLSICKTPERSPNRQWWPPAAAHASMLQSSSIRRVPTGKKTGCLEQVARYFTPSRARARASWTCLFRMIERLSFSLNNSPPPPPPSPRPVPPTGVLLKLVAAFRVQGSGFTVVAHAPRAFDCAWSSLHL